MKQLLASTLLLVSYLSLQAQDPVNLRFNLKKGFTNQMKSISKQNIQTSYNGTPFTTQVNSSAVISYTLLSQEKDVMRLEFRFDTILVKTVTPMMTKEINSAVPAKSKDYMERMLNRFSAGSIIAKISTAGKFIGFENYKTFRDNILQIMDSVPANKKDQLQKQFDTMVKESAVQSMIEPQFAYLPENPVKSGDQWETTIQQSSGGIPIAMFNTYTLNKAGQASVNVSLTSEVEALPSTDPLQTMTSDIKGKSTGTMEIDVATGQTIKSSTKTHAEGTMKIKNQGNEMSLPVTVDSESQIFSVK